MTRRGRAIVFLIGALICAGLAVAVVNGRGAGISAQLGPLRPVVVVRSDLRAGREIRPKVAERALELRRVPERFAAPDALGIPEEAVGRTPNARIPAGSYLVGSQLRLAEAKPHHAPSVGEGRSPVDIAISGGGALLAAGRGAGRARVDAVVTSERTVNGRGRTFVAARGVRLLALTEGGGDVDELPGPPQWTATLALTRKEALRLIQAESFARQIRLLPRAP